MLGRFFRLRRARVEADIGQGDRVSADAGERRVLASELAAARKTLSRLESRQKRAGTYVAFDDSDTTDVDLFAARARLRDLQQELARREAPDGAVAAVAY